MQLDRGELSGILTRGGTILGTSREKPHRMHFNGKRQDMTDVIVENYQAHHLDALVCIGGGGTQKNALQLVEKGLNVITLPKTIDNDVAHTDTTFGFDTALGIATDAIDRLHSTAHSHHRIIVVEIMGHRAGWLALGSGVAGGADVILLPEIPYDIESVAEAIRGRAAGGKPFSIVAVAEGALPRGVAEEVQDLRERKQKATDKKTAQTAEVGVERDGISIFQPYRNPLPRVGGADRSGVTSDHTRLSATGWNTLRRRPVAGNPPGYCLCRSDCGGAVWGDGCIPR